MAKDESTAMDKAPPKGEAKGEGEGEGEGKKESRLSWMVGWVLVPTVVIGTIFGGGVLVGAHLHDSWYTRLVVWIVELF